MAGATRRRDLAAADTVHREIVVAATAADPAGVADTVVAVALVAVVTAGVEVATAVEEETAAAGLPPVPLHPGLPAAGV